MRRVPSVPVPRNITRIEAAAELARAARIIERARQRLPHTDDTKVVRKDCQRAMNTIVDAAGKLLRGSYREA